MRLLFIRHAEPDYEHDSITERGEREARLLAERLEKEKIDGVYISPLGRAQKTAQAYLERVRGQGETCDWLQEFAARVRHPGSDKLRRIWDFLPSVAEQYPQLYSAENWLKVPFIGGTDVPFEYARVCGELDALLQRHGYRRRGMFYEAFAANKKTLVFFCHLGITGVLLSHLFNQSPVAILQSFAGAPTCVTEVVTEEREEGIASFRAHWIGDVSHLYKAGEPPSFYSSGYCEVFSDDTMRH